MFVKPQLFPLSHAFLRARSLNGWTGCWWFDEHTVYYDCSGYIGMLRWLTMANGSGDEAVTRSILNEAVDAILEGVGKLVDEVRSDTKTSMDGLESRMNQRFDNLEAKVTQTRTELKDEIDGLKADLSATASRSELEELKSKLN